MIALADCTYVVHLLKMSHQARHVLCEFMHWYLKNEHTFVKNKNRHFTVTSRHPTFAKMNKPMKIVAKA